MDIKTIDKNMADAKITEKTFKWFNGLNEPFTIHGLYWVKENKNFHRLRDTLETREYLKNLSMHPSGAYISFATDSTSIQLRVKNSSAAYMSHMSACGQGGLDLYFLNNDKYTFLTTTKINKAEYEITIIKDMDKKLRTFRLYLPLYIALLDLEIGFDSDSIVESAEPIREEKIICYGTSISQGGCATRPGMNYSSILERLLKKYEVYNFGFSGNAHLDYEVASDIATIDHIKYIIIESESNNTYERTNERLMNFITILLEKNPNAIIYVLSHYPHPFTNINKKLYVEMKKHKILHKVVCNRLSDNVIYIDGEKILKSFDYEETVDNVHLTDLGFYFVAKYFEKLIKKNEE